MSGNKNYKKLESSDNNVDNIFHKIKKDAKAKFTPDQIDFMGKWKGGAVSRVDSVDAALRALGVIKKVL